MDVTSEIVDKVTHQHHGQRAPNEVIAQILSTLNGLKDDSDDIVAAIITSSDGLPWAQVLPNDFDVKRFSAMSSAILALSITMAREAGSRRLIKNRAYKMKKGHLPLFMVRKNIPMIQPSSHYIEIIGSLGIESQINVQHVVDVLSQKEENLKHGERFTAPTLYTNICQ
ncbi:MAG: roadblock/LC7 domain-containing protein [Thiotrichaceae bacterium]|nr:roadblock/LC7 domain-containing protein [Thiotrichaceae bacterium]